MVSVINNIFNMGLLNQQNVLARLYVDDDFRAAFIAEPQKYGQLNKLNQMEIEDIKAILPDEIAAFAESLYFKRLREVEKLLPRLRKEIGDKFEYLFRKFSTGFNATSVKKHLEDAFLFCEFLMAHPELSKNEIELARFEHAKLDFYGYGKSFVLRWFSSGLDLGFKKRKRFGLWVRFGRKEFIF